ncbi:MAG: ribonuclease HI [Zoogloeaceae bacterium]|jgi:ribonuclease HI|nr:ribonuclease HI [Zoogloeaceae bacterium]
MNEELLIEIYADGACSGNPGPGGWGVLLLCGGNSREIWGGEAHTTNNRMELTAVIQALQALKRPATARIYTDSTYVQQGISQWIHNWKRRGWKTADKSPVKNVDLWKELDRVAALHQLEWLWIKGHAGNSGNERADRLARRGIEEVLETRRRDSGSALPAAVREEKQG